MLRTRLVVTMGTLLATIGVVVLATAVAWLATNWGTGPHIYDPEGPLYKQVSAARLGVIAGAAVLLAGAGLVIFGLIARKRAS